MNNPDLDLKDLLGSRKKKTKIDYSSKVKAKGEPEDEGIILPKPKNSAAATMLANIKSGMVKKFDSLKD